MSDPAAVPIRLVLVAATAILLTACRGFVVTPSQPTHTLVPATVAPATEVVVTETPPATPGPGSVTDQVPSEEPSVITPTETATLSATPQPAGSETSLIGRWGSGRSAAAGLPPEPDLTAPTLEILEDGAFTMAFYFGEETPFQVMTGTWSLRDDGSLDLSDRYVAVPHANLLFVQYAPMGTLAILQKFEGNGSLRPYNPNTRITPPALQPSSIITMTINDSWTGLSPAAPVEALFHLKPDTTAFYGAGDLSAAGYRNPITGTVAVSVPVSVIEEFLRLVALTPLEEGDYQPVFSHTDDYPYLAVDIRTTSGTIAFSTESQGMSHIPWRVRIDEKDYVTYADTLALAMAELDPYLAHAERDKLVEQALKPR